MITLLIPIMAIRLINSLLDLFPQQCIFCIGDKVLTCFSSLTKIGHIFARRNKRGKKSICSNKS